jgi:hypothetical protein
MTISCGTPAAASAPSKTSTTSARIPWSAPPNIEDRRRELIRQSVGAGTPPRAATGPP